MGFATGVSQLNGIELDLEMLKFDADIGIFSIKVMVAVYLAGEAPIVINEEGVM